MDEELGGNNTSPNIEYPFIPKLVKFLVMNSSR